MGSVSALVDDYISSSIKTDQNGLISTLRSVALNDPNLCSDIAQSIKRKLNSQLEAEQIKAIDLLDAVTDSFDLTFHQVIHEKSYLSFLEKILNNDQKRVSKPVFDKVKNLFTKWVSKFSIDADILPNFQMFYARLVEQGITEPINKVELPVVVVKNSTIESSSPKIVVAPHESQSAAMMDHYLINEAEGQDPEEFKVEVTETLALFDEVYTAITKVKPISALDEGSRREALISIASNLDRYSEQFGLWIEQLEPGDYMTEAMALNDKVTDALQRYKKLRSGVVKSLAYESESSEEYGDSSSSSDDD